MKLLGSYLRYENNKKQHKWHLGVAGISAGMRSGLSCFTLSRRRESEADKGQRNPGTALHLLHSLSLSLSFPHCQLVTESWASHAYAEQAYKVKHIHMRKIQQHCQRQRKHVLKWRFAISGPNKLQRIGSWIPFRDHPLKFERYREDKHGLCARMTRTNRVGSVGSDSWESSLNVAILSRHVQEWKPVISNYTGLPLQNAFCLHQFNN